MKRLAFAVLIASIMMGAPTYAAYVTSFPSAATSNDFSRAQIGQTGNEPSSTVTWQTGSAILEARYSQHTSLALIKGDSGSGLNNGVFSNSTAILSFDFYNGASTDTGWVEIGINMANSTGANNFPSYYARVVTNHFFLFRHHAYNDFSIVDSETLGSTASGTNFALIISAENTGGTSVGLSAALKQNGSTLADLSYTDAAGYLSGYAGFSGGQGEPNTSTFMGIEATEFSVAQIPEPGSIGLLFVAAGLLRFFRKR
jgi:hypothetical protein